MDVFDIIDRYYGENGALRSILLTHSKRVAEKALRIAGSHPSLAVDTDFVYSAAMLHDIGIIRCNAPDILCRGREPYIRHGVCGAAMLLSGEWDGAFARDKLERWARVCERHTGTGLTAEEITAQRMPLPASDFLPESVEEKIICYADKFYSKKHVNEEKPLEKVLRAMKRFSPASYERFLALHEMFG
ncbi:MAG: HD domain-containing protein [Prevotella sp.]|nr:HD domain-containing protein [Prevotella sp.]